MGTLDNFAYILMKILTAVLLFGSLGICFFIGAVWKKNNGY